MQNQHWFHVSWLLLLKRILGMYGINQIQSKYMASITDTFYLDCPAD